MRPNLTMKLGKVMQLEMGTCAAFVSSFSILANADTLAKQFEMRAKTIIRRPLQDRVALQTRLD